MESHMKNCNEKSQTKSASNPKLKISNGLESLFYPFSFHSSQINSKCLFI